MTVTEDGEVEQKLKLQKNLKSLLEKSLTLK